MGPVDVFLAGHPLAVLVFVWVFLLAVFFAVPVYSAWQEHRHGDFWEGVE